jgi:hypothetical protein
MICLIIGKDSIQRSESIVLSKSPDVSSQDRRKGYDDIVFFQGNYIAVGTGGRIDCITQSVEKTPLDTSCRFDLHCAYANDKIFLAAGDRGNILYSTDGKNFHTADSDTKTSINTITCKNGMFIAGADSGTILGSMDGISWSKIQTNIRGNILSLSSNESFFIGVTDAGEIIKSIDGKTWGIEDYNEKYAGYNASSMFRKILAGPNNIMIIGKHSDGSPSILFSTLGSVWTERPPIYQDEQGAVQGLSKTPNGITYDADRDQFVIACDDGELLALPPCAKCNKWAKISDVDFQSIIYHDNSFLIVGEEFSVLIQRIF